MTEDLPFTGERFVPEQVREIWYEHWHRYAFALPFVEGRSVLDCACGEGYGSALLAGRAATVSGVDISARAVAHARKRYGAGRDNLEFIEADCANLPFEDDAFDVVVSFETLEHIERQSAMLDEFRRVLRPEGLLILSSPDKHTYSDERGYHNEYHVRELYRDELVALVEERFPAWRLYGQKLMFHSVVWSLDEPGGSYRYGTVQQDGNYRESPAPAHAPLYFIMLCAANENALPESPAALDLFDDAEESVYEHYNAEVRHHIESGKVFEEMKRRIRELESGAGRESLFRRIRRWLGGGGHGG